jgi:hypothetical protein
MRPHNGTLIMVLGILSIVIFQIILGPIAWIMGHNDLKEIRAGRMDPAGEGPTNTGRICGMVGTIIGIVAVVLACAWFAIVLMFLGMAPRHMQ